MAWTHYIVFLLSVLVIVIAQGPRRSIVPAVPERASFLLCSRPVLTPQDIQPPVSATCLGGHGGRDDPWRGTDLDRASAPSVHNEFLRLDTSGT
jgi:hypothetical protein